MSRWIRAAAPALLLALVAGPSAGGAPTAEEVRTAVRDGWASHTGRGVTIEVLEVPQLPAEEPDGAGLIVEAPTLPLVAGVRPVAVSRVVDGRVVARGLATVRVRREVSVWVTTRAIAKGETLIADDLRREPRLFEREPARELLADFEPARWTARRALEAGTVLRGNDVRRRPDVAAGASIRLVARAGDACVSVPARARQSGEVGDTIVVLNPLTGALVRALVLDPGTAELNPAGRPARTGPTAEGVAP